MVKNDKVKLGELYEKWQKKTNKSIGRTGVFDDVAEDAVGEGTVPKKGQKGGGKKTSSKRDEGDERKTAIAIRKEREKKENMRLKNMKKGDRRQLERKQRSDKAAGDIGKESFNKGKKKGGPNKRWGSNKTGSRR